MYVSILVHWSHHFISNYQCHLLCTVCKYYWKLH